MTRAIVLGAGVLGASVAYHLARAGSEVTVIEARGPAGGTSSATFSIDVTHLKTPVPTTSSIGAAPGNTANSRKRTTAPPGCTLSPDPVGRLRGLAATDQGPAEATGILGASVPSGGPQ